MGGLEEQSGFWDEETMVALVGIDKVKITNPLRAGDTLRVYGEVIRKEGNQEPRQGNRSAPQRMQESEGRDSRRNRNNPPC